MILVRLHQFARASANHCVADALRIYIRDPNSKMIVNRGAHGKPVLQSEREQLHFNLSHSQHLSVLGVCHSAPLGLDIEAEREVQCPTEVINMIAHSQELANLKDMYRREGDRAILEMWVRKEACLKALGSGLTRHPRSIQVLDHSGWLSSVEAGGDITLRVKTLQLHCFHAAVAVVSKEEFTHQWAAM